MLDRQMLLRRRDIRVTTAVEQLLGLNAQDANVPYLALWTRLEPFAISDLTSAIEDRSLVRSTMMRATQHLMAAQDFRLVRPALTPLLQRVQRNAFGSRTVGIDLDELVADASKLLAGGQILTRPELGRKLAESRPGADPSALGWTVQYLLPIFHPAPSGTWNTYGASPFAATDWLGIPQHATTADVCELIRRYLKAFGPATISDARAWSGIGGLKEIFESLRTELRGYADESGREVFDLPDQPLPDPDTPAPVRFLPAFDAPLLAYADRTRVMTDEIRAKVCNGAAVAATVLVDGTVAATWTRARTGETVKLAVHPLRQLSTKDIAAIEAEAARLLAFSDPDATTRDVQLTADRSF